MHDPALIIDVAHPPLHPDEVEAELLNAVARVRNSPDLRILKIIHGYGSTGRGGSTREIVRNWIYRQRRSFRGSIPGEEYTLFNGATQEMRKEVGQYDDSDLRVPNAGITLLWVK